jgi:magnesium transporter
MNDTGIVAAAAYAGGRRICDISLGEARDWVHRPEHFVWIGLHEPDADILSQVQSQFNLHPLAIEDAAKAHQRPKIEQYGEALFIVARTAQIVDERIAFGETHLFVGHGYIVSVRHGPSTSYRAVRERCESCRSVLARGEHYVLYAILDFIVDNYAPVVEHVEAQVEVIEEDVIAMRLQKSDIERLYTLRRGLLKLRNAIAPLVDVCRRLEHTELLAIEASMQPLFRDVTDHVRRVQEQIDALREVLAFAFEANLLLSQTELNATTRKLAAWAAILAIPTAVAGIYGMNFDYIPELKWAYGYFVVLGVTISACVALYWRFRRDNWL